MTAKNQTPKPPEGYDRGGTPDIDGWHKPQINTAVHGQIVGHMVLKSNNNNEPRDVVLLKLLEPCTGYDKGDDAGHALKKGDILGVGVSYDIREILEYVEHKAKAWLNPIERKPLPGAKHLWKYDQRYHGQKGKIPINSVAAGGSSNGSTASTADDDDVPF